MHQIYQGHYFRPEADPTAPDFNPVAEALSYMGIRPGVDGGDFAGHADAQRWTTWTCRPASMHAMDAAAAAPDTPQQQSA